jgi:hypothetical protein
LELFVSAIDCTCTSQPSQMARRMVTEARRVLIRVHTPAGLREPAEQAKAA